MTVEATLCAIISDGRILLQRKAAGRFGEGKWNGAGGKLEPGEDPVEGVIREVLEETGLRIREPRRHGRLDHYFGDRSVPAWSVHVFSATEFDGEAVGGEEGELRWFPVEEIPYGEMWENKTKFIYVSKTDQTSYKNTLNQEIPLKNPPFFPNAGSSSER